jgi:APA family basic amino acid/polyamine antiporter
MVFYVWSSIGLIFYFAYGFWKSNVRRGVIETVDLDDSAGGQPPA